MMTMSMSMLRSPRTFAVLFMLVSLFLVAYRVASPATETPALDPEPTATARPTTPSPTPTSLPRVAANVSSCIPDICFRFAHLEPKCTLAHELACLKWMQTESVCTPSAYGPSPVHSVSSAEEDGADAATPPAPPHLQFHMYWTGPVPEVAMLTVRSLFATQPRARLTLWTREPFDALGPVRHQITSLPNVTLARFDPNAEWAAIRHLFPLVAPDLVFPAPVNDHPETYYIDMANYADMARLFIVYRHGGVYIDMDILFLRDFTPLLHLAPFMYGWACHNYTNNAIIAAAPRAPALHALLNAVLSKGREVDVLAFYPRTLSLTMVEATFEGPHIRVLSSYLFDPVWIRFDKMEPPGVGLGHPCDKFQNGFAEFFERPVEGWVTNRTQSTAPAPSMCHPAFAYHWHNQWTATVRERSAAWHAAAAL